MKGIINENRMYYNKRSSYMDNESIQTKNYEDFEYNRKVNELRE